MGRLEDVMAMYLWKRHRFLGFANSVKSCSISAKDTKLIFQTCLDMLTTCGVTEKL